MEDQQHEKTRLTQPSAAADMAPLLLKSKDSNNGISLKSLKTDLLQSLNNNKGKIQNRGFKSLDQIIAKAVRPVKFNNIKKGYLDKLNNVKEVKRPYALSQTKALTFKHTYIVNVIVYIRNNPNRVDEATGKLTHTIKPAFTDIVGNRYWMVSIGDGVRQYTINTPKGFKSSTFVKRQIFKYQIKTNHEQNIRNETTGLTPEYQTMLHYFESAYDFLSWYGFIADYPHAFHMLSAVEISNDGSLYNPLEAKLKDVSKVSIANKYIMRPHQIYQRIHFMKLYN